MPAIPPTTAFALVALLIAGAPSGASPARDRAAPPPNPPDVLLITLDTTRADAVGAYGSAKAKTPHLDRLAARGLRYETALTASPLTLPAHASLMTGLAPPEHGLRDNGGTALGPGPKTLAQELRRRGYSTAAFVASRVLDRRFGLDRGFEHYDDRMAAERLGEYGYPERDAAAVTDSALSWLPTAPEKLPLFLWVHYYDPHAPYRAPGPGSSDDPQQAYAREVEYVDLHIGRLLEAFKKRRPHREVLTAVVGDHGEALGEHGERAHGIFLYRASLEVPLLLAGPSIPAGKTVSQTIATRRLAATLLHLTAGAAGRRTRPSPVPEDFGPPLPGLPGIAAPAPQPVYSETFLPSSAYGWSPLKAISDERWRLVVAPRPELFDLAQDPGETHNRIDDRRREARRLQRALERLEASFQEAEGSTVEIDAELAASLRSLGYAAGARKPPKSGLDPKDGILLLAQIEEAKALTRQRRFAEALSLLRELNRKSPDNVPFLGRLAFAQLQSGDAEAALTTYRRAVELNPRLDFLHFNLAKALRRSGKPEAALKELRITLELNPRFSEAWLNLAQMAQAAGDSTEERRILEEAVAAETTSALILTRLAQIEMAAREEEAAAMHLATATELLPDWSTAWLVRGQLALRRGDREAARKFLQLAATQAPASADGRAAQRLLEQIAASKP